MLKKVCSYCKNTVENVQKNGILHCENCYKAFKKEISDICLYVHGKDSHIGKNPLQQMKLGKIKSVSFDSNIVKNCSITLVRNIEKMPFHLEDVNKLNGIKEKVNNLLNKYGNFTYNSNQFICESDNVKVLINCDEFIKIQAVGLDIKKCYEIADKIDNLLYGELGFAFDSKFGYLTSNIKSLGTGLKISMLLNLPNLFSSANKKDLLVELNKLGFSLERTNILQPNLFYLTNIVTLGVTETQIINTIIETALAVCKAEKAVIKG